MKLHIIIMIERGS